MGGLVGGAIASGMSADELAAMLAQVEWDEMFGFSPFRYKNICRKDDARDYPSRIEFGIKRGLRLPAIGKATSDSARSVDVGGPQSRRSSSIGWKRPRAIAGCGSTSPVTT
jgi:hypothetical protein